MRIKKYIKEIKDRIQKYNKYVTNPINYENINNPFSSVMTKTYIWIEEGEGEGRKS